MPTIIFPVGWNPAVGLLSRGPDLPYDQNSKRSTPCSRRGLLTTPLILPKLCAFVRLKLGLPTLRTLGVPAVCQVLRSL